MGALTFTMQRLPKRSTGTRLTLTPCCGRNRQGPMIDEWSGALTMVLSALRSLERKVVGLAPAAGEDDLVFSASSRAATWPRASSTAHLAADDAGSPDGILGHAATIKFARTPRSLLPPCGLPRARTRRPSSKRGPSNRSRPGFLARPAISIELRWINASTLPQA